MYNGTMSHKYTDSFRPGFLQGGLPYWNCPHRAYSQLCCMDKLPVMNCEVVSAWPCMLS